MSMISITKGGRLYESDSARKDGLGFGRMPTPVFESSTMLSNPKLFSEQQAAMREAEGLAKVKLAQARATKAAKAQAAELLKNKDRARLMRNQVPVVSRADQLIKGELMRQKNSNADFFQYERIADHQDFGHHMSGRADFQTYSIAPTGSPLTRDGSYGPVTDFDRYVQGKRFARGIPSGMSGQPQMGDFFSDIGDTLSAGVQNALTNISLQDPAVLLSQVGLVKPPTPAPAPAPAMMTKYMPAAITTGTVSVLGLKIPKWQITLGVVAIVGVTATVVGVKLMRKKT